MLSRVACGLGLAILAVTAGSAWVEQGQVVSTPGVTERITPSLPAVPKVDAPTCGAPSDAALLGDAADGLTAALATKAEGNQCGWRDPNGVYIGHWVTYIPPDDPASAGYVCRGFCHDSHCSKDEPIDEGGGVASQSCLCEP